MYCQLVREDFSKTSTEGKWFTNGEFECFILEDKDRKLEDGGEKVYGKTAIPRGIYSLTISSSNRFQKDLIEILDVPQFTGIRVHWGNDSEDTDGCPLTGATNNKKDDDWIGNSKVAYDKLHEKIEKALQRGEEVTLEIV